VAIADEVSFRSLHGGPRHHPGSVGVPGLFSPLLLFGHLFLLLLFGNLYEA
jgi:hypothetical protein